MKLNAEVDLLGLLRGRSSFLKLRGIRRLVCLMEGEQAWGSLAAGSPFLIQARLETLVDSLLASALPKIVVLKIIFLKS